MRIEEYQQVEDIIYNKYPSGIDFMLLGNIDTLWEELSGKTHISDNFDSETVIHQLNIRSTKKHLSKYKVNRLKYYKLLKYKLKDTDKAYKKKINGRISSLFNLINDCKNNIKMSEYFIDQQPIEENHQKIKNISI